MKPKPSYKAKRPEETVSCSVFLSDNDKIMSSHDVSFAHRFKYKLSYRYMTFNYLPRNDQKLCRNFYF